MSLKQAQREWKRLHAAQPTRRLVLRDAPDAWRAAHPTAHKMCGKVAVVDADTGEVLAV